MEDLSKLIDLAKSEGEVVYSENERNKAAYRFFKKMNITKGRDEIYRNFFFLLYLHYCKSKIPLSKKTFNMCLSKHLKLSKTREVVYIDFKSLTVDVKLLKKMVFSQIFKKARNEVKKKRSPESETPNTDKKGARRLRLLKKAKQI